MRIVTLQEFLKLPPWTMYRKYQPCFTEDICWKMDSIEGTGDFVYTSASMPDGGGSDEVIAACADMEENGASYPLEDFTARDGCYVDDQLFMVYEHDDILKFAQYVQNALTVTPPKPKP